MLPFVMEKLTDFSSLSYGTKSSTCNAIALPDYNIEITWKALHPKVCTLFIPWIILSNEQSVFSDSFSKIIPQFSFYR